MIAEQQWFTLREALMEFSSERTWQAFAHALNACRTAGLRDGAVIGAVPGTSWFRNRTLIANRNKAQNVLCNELARKISTGEFEITGIEVSDDHKQLQTIAIHRLQGVLLNVPANSLTADGSTFVEIRVRCRDQAIDSPAPKPAGAPPKNWPAYGRELVRYKTHEGKNASEKDTRNHLHDWGIDNLPRKERATLETIGKKLPVLYEFISL